MRTGFWALAAAGLFWSHHGLSYAGVCWNPAACRSRLELTPEAVVPTNFRLVLHLGCDASQTDIQGLSPTTLFPELLLDNGTVLQSDWVNYADISTEYRADQVFCRLGDPFPPGSSIRIQSRFDGYCELRDSICDEVPPIDCSRADSCCNLDEAPFQDIGHFFSGSEADRSPPQPVQQEVVCSGSAGYTTAGVVSFVAVDLFAIRIYGRRGDEPDTSTQLVGELLKEYGGGGPDELRFFARGGPLGEKRNDDVAALTGTWLFATQAVDYAGNESELSPESALVYPADCPGYQPQSAETPDASAASPDASSPNLDASADVVDVSTNRAEPPNDGGCGCSFHGQSPPGPGIVALFITFQFWRIRRPRTSDTKPPEQPGRASKPVTGS